MKHVIIMSLNASPLEKVYMGGGQQLRHNSGSPVIKAMKIKDPCLYQGIIFTNIKK